MESGATDHHVVKLVGVVLSLSTQEPPGQSSQERQSYDSSDNTSNNRSRVCYRQTTIASTGTGAISLGFSLQKVSLRG
jgi:hypothetical protein